MALTKIKLDEVDVKATPVLADSVLLSDSADGGRGKISTLTDLQTLIGGGGGGGAVDSVAGKTGDVTLDASDISETAALKIMTADERTKLTGIAEGAEVNTVDSVAGKTGDVTLDADDVSTTASKLWMSDTQASKLSGIAENANNYTHPATHPQSMIEGLADALAANAPLASPALTGTPTAPTAASGTDTTQIATTAFVHDAIADISIDADPYAVQLTGDQSISGIKTFTSSPVLPTPTAGDDTTKAATTAFVQAAVAGVGGAVDSVAGKIGVVTLDADDVSETATKLWMTDAQASKLSGIAENANNYTHPATHPQSMIEGLADALAAKATLASPAFTGTPTAPTAAPGTNTTQIATTAFCGNFNQKWTYSYAGLGGAINASEWTMHAFGASGTLRLPLASSVASGVQVAAIVVKGGAEVVLVRSGPDQFVTPTGLAATYTLRGNGSSIVLVRATDSAWACVGAPDSLINAALTGALLTEGTPSGPTATGTKGMARFDADYFYVCTATNTWARFPKDGAWT